MKSLILITLIATALLTLGSSNVAAASSDTEVPYFAPKVFKVKTAEIERCQMQKLVMKSNGEAIRFWVTVVTFKDVFSDGSNRIWKRTIRA